MLPLFVIDAFDSWLDQRDLRMEATIVGGSALA